MLFTFPVTLDIAPDYLDCIQTPMAIKTMREKVYAFAYPTWEAFKVGFVEMDEK